MKMAQRAVREQARQQQGSPTGPHDRARVFGLHALVLDCEFKKDGTSRHENHREHTEQVDPPPPLIADRALRQQVRRFGGRQHHGDDQWQYHQRQQVTAPTDGGCQSTQQRTHRCQTQVAQDSDQQYLPGTFAAMADRQVGRKAG